MANISRSVFLVLFTLTAIITLIAIGLTAAGILSTGWQIMVEPGSGEVHQHGLWLDYNKVIPHVAGAPAPSRCTDHENDGCRWQFNYKFGVSVRGDESHRAKAYQEITLILVAVSIGVAVIALGVSFVSFCLPVVGIVWSVLLLAATVIGAAGLIEFYVSAMMADNRFVYTDRKIEQTVGYSFERSLIGVIGFGLALILSIITNVFNVINRRYGGVARTAPFVFKKGNNTQV